MELIVTGSYDKDEGDDLSLGVRFKSEPCLGSRLDRALVVVMRIEDTVGLGCDEIIYDFAADSCWGWVRLLPEVMLGLSSEFSAWLEVRFSFAGRSAFCHLVILPRIYLFIARKSRNAGSNSNGKVPS